MPPVKVRIELTARSAGSRVFVDGHEIKGIRSVTVRASVDADGPQVSEVVLTLVTTEVEIEGNAGHVIEDRTTFDSVARDYAKVPRGDG